MFLIVPQRILLLKTYLVKVLNTYFMEGFQQYE
jgi:hypothetical protein